MSQYALTFRPGAVSDFQALPDKTKPKVAQVLEALVANPFCPATRVLQGDLRPYRRARAGDYRIIYVVDLEAHRIRIIVIGLRSDICKRVARMHE